MNALTRKLVDWLVPPTAYCLMLLFFSLTLYEIMTKLLGMIPTQGLLIQ